MFRITSENEGEVGPIKLVKVTPSNSFMTVSVTFHLKYIHISFSSVWVAEWPPFAKLLLTRLTIFSLCILTICN